MSQLRGVGPFAELWERRTTIEDREGHLYDILGLSDLVAAKKTQRAKDWPMIARLLEAHYIENSPNFTENEIAFGFARCRRRNI